MDAAKREQLEQTTRYDPQAVESRVFAEWMDGGYFHPEATGTPEENFSVAIPPPNVTGVLHMGHALNGSMQDALVADEPDAGTTRSGSSAPTTPASPPRPVVEEEA